MKLYFIRHGKASYDAPNDELRPLLPEGIEQAQDLGHVLKQLGVRPSRIYTSPRLRAKETAEHIGNALGINPEVTEACNFDFSLEKALKLAEGFGEDADILFVGHNPSMSEAVTEALVSRMVGRADTLQLATDVLSDRELEVFGLIGSGFGTKEIAHKLGLSVKTIDTYREHLKLKLRLKSGVELVRFALQWVNSERKL